MKDLFLLSAYTSKMNATGWLAGIGIGIGTIIGFIFSTKALAAIFVGLLVLDFITGIMASKKRGENITSSRMRDMGYKWITYLVILLVGGCLDIVIGTVWIHTAALGWIMVSEGVSILENCEEILGKKIPFLGRIRIIIDAMRGTGDKDEINSIADNTIQQKDDTETSSS